MCSLGVSPGIHKQVNGTVFPGFLNLFLSVLSPVLSGFLWFPFQILRHKVEALLSDSCTLLQLDLHLGPSKRITERKKNAMEIDLTFLEPQLQRTRKKVFLLKNFNSCLLLFTASHRVVRAGQKIT